jgi:DNA-binding PadR family transcriptional regulator
LEIEILVEAIRLAAAGQSEFHGFAMAKELRHGSQRDTLIGHGTLYKALGRLETGGLLSSRLEDPDLAAEAGRPRRRLYTITGAGRVAAVKARAEPAYGELGLLGPEPT